ncbi:hypothetical protein HNS38_18970 [Lentimicrobium sp. L6]|uniref:OB-fold protein n=1 Tax=Lentimicrobium sp. L6 TaxID=2735916 RepID=UPI001551EC65|nr:hypothetical protein [Lentimicrobium sp. L6]NPD86852.1 hypothetical protein [Lentimicrobium sp. L6]
MLKKIILGLLLIGLIAGVYGYFFMYNKSHPDYQNLDAEISITAKELFDKCKNEGKSQEFTGKIVELSGTPQEIENNEGVKTMVFVYDQGMFGPEGVRATFLADYNDDLELLAIDKPVLLKAYCTGYNESDVVLEKASLIKK